MPRHLYQIISTRPTKICPMGASGSKVLHETLVVMSTTVSLFICAKGLRVLDSQNCLCSTVYRGQLSKDIRPTGALPSMCRCGAQYALPGVRGAACMLLPGRRCCFSTPPCSLCGCQILELPRNAHANQVAS